MFIHYVLRLFLIASCAALMTACGSGSSIGGNANNNGGTDNSSGNGSSPQRDVPWASPAMILEDGEESTTIGLTLCSNGLQTASLVVTAAGDMIFSGAPAGSTTVSELNRINYATATDKEVKGQTNPSGPQLSFELGQDGNSMSASTYDHGNNRGNFQSYKASEAPLFYSCSLVNGTQAFTLNVLPSSQRIGKHMTSGVTRITTPTGTTASFNAGLITWDNLQVNGGTTPVDLRPFRFFQINTATGAIATSNSATGPFSNPWTVSLPIMPTSTFVRFEEKVDTGIKSLALEADQPGVSLPVQFYIERDGNIFTPYAQWIFN
jgi:hypothetical protein